MHKLSLALWVVVSTLFLSHESAVATGERRMITISAGQEGGVYYPAAGVICRLLHLESERHGIRCAVDRSRGSIENVKNLAHGRSDIGIVQTDVQYAAINGEFPIRHSCTCIWPVAFAGFLTSRAHHDRHKAGC